MHYPQYQRCVAVLLLLGLLLQSCRPGLHAVVQKPNPPMGREISNHGPDSITSTPAMGIVPDSIASISSTTVVPDSITSTPAIGIVPDSVASISSVAIGPDSITSTPAMGIVPDSIASISSTTVVSDSITSTPAIGIVPDSVASISSVAIGPDSITSKEVPTSRLKRKCQHPALPLHPYSLKSTEEEVPASTPIPSMAIGPKEWTQYFGEVGTAPPLPADIDAILDSPCSFWPGKQVKDTHLLVLVPATVDGIPFTLDLLGELIKSPQGSGSKTQYRYYDGGTVQKELGAKSPGSSYWVLMTRDVLPGSRNKTYDAQKALVASHARSLRLPYEMPHALEAATAILLHHARTGERLYTDDPWTYTRCQEKVVNNMYPVFGGGFSSGGLRVHGDVRVSHYCIGVSCLRKF